ncbi:MAG: pyridoxal phosphate-dependent aminotransferase [Spirochaetes bacterium]|nr:pyridoxal phosphate-dependent aminotransferase [Spirochaetota bacterium]
MAISERVRKRMESASWIRQMFEMGNALKAKHGTAKVCDFSLGNPNVEPPEEFTSTLKDILHEEIRGRHRYMPNGGYPEVRRKVAEYVSGEQGVSLKGDHLILTCGAGGGLNVALKTIINPGDRVLVSTPFFMEYASYADNHGGVLQTVPGLKNFEPDIDAIASRITDKTAALIINSPNNPSGHVYPEDTVQALGALLKKKSKETGRAIYLISDEPYRKIVYDGMVVPPIFPLYKHSIIVSSYSKDLSIPGERIGWLAVNPAADDLDELMNGIVLCNRILGYVNAPALMQRAIERLQGFSVNIELYQHKRDLLCGGLSKLGYDFIKPKGTFYLFPRAPGGDDMQFVQALQEELVLAVPGSGFGSPGHFRIAYCVEDEVIETSMQGFERAIRKVQ